MRDQTAAEVLPPLIAPLAQDPDREAVYSAEETWEMDAFEQGLLDSQPDHLQPDEVSSFSQTIMRRAGWNTAPPVIRFDVPDDDPRAGWHTGHDHVIHLHPRLLSPTLVLHEVSHWLDNRDGHGPIFQANLVTLIEAAHGADASRLLLDYYVEHGLTPDPWRLPEWADDLRRQALHRSLNPSLRDAVEHQGSPPHPESGEETP